MDITKRFSVLLITAITAVSLVSCGQATSSNVSSDSEVSSVINVKVSAWDNLNDKEKDFYKGLEKKGHTIDKDTGYVYIDAAGFQDDWGRTYGNEGIVITYWFGNEDIVHIPEEIDGKKVVNIANAGMREFRDTNDTYHNLGYIESEIKELYFPEDFQEIYCAFDHFETLEIITLPKSQTVIQYGGFRHCINLKEFICPDDITIINDFAFSNCKSMTSFTFNNGLKTIGQDAFSGCESLEKLDFPDSLESIGIQSFQGCTGLKEINIPSKIDTIPKRAFFACKALEALVLPDNITTINSEAFARCNSLKEIYIPESVNEIAENAFDECDSLTIKGKSGSYAEEYAKENDIDFAAE